METKTVAQGRDGCTVTAASEVVFPIRKDYYHVRNDSENTVYASVFSAELDPAEDGVYAVPAGGNIAIKSHGSDRVYVSGGVTVIGTGSAISPFKLAQRGGDITAAGNPVQIDGLQGGVPFSEMAVSGKNLIGIAQAKTIIGDSTSGYSVINNAISRTIIQKLQPNTTYHIKKYDSGNRFRIVMFDNEPTNAADITAKQLIFNSDGSISDYTLSTGDNHLWMALVTHFATSGEAIEPIVQLEYGDTATAYEPPITGQNITLWACKKNLIPYPYSRASGTYNGIELIVHDDGRFDMSGTATASFAILVFAGSSNPIYLSGGQTYTISCNTPYDFSKFNLSARIYHTDGSYTPIIKFPTTFVAQEGEYLTCALWIESDVSVSAKNVELQLEYGDTATDYEPYSGATYTITPDSNPYVIPNDIRQQDGLNNISVSAGTLSVTGVRKNAAIKRIWNEIDEIKTAIIVSNGETE